LPENDKILEIVAAEFDNYASFKVKIGSGLGLGLGCGVVAVVHLTVMH